MSNGCPTCSLETFPTLAQERLRELAEEQRREGQVREAFGGAFDSADYEEPTNDYEEPTNDFAIYRGIEVEVTDPISPDGTSLEEIREEAEAIRLQPYYDLIRRANTVCFEDVAQEIFDELFDLLVERQVKYGPKNVEQQGLYGLLVRMRDDKISRIQRSFNGCIENGQIVLDLNLGGEEGDTLEDAYKDLANYAVISLMVLRGLWGKPLKAEVGFDD